MKRTLIVIMIIFLITSLTAACGEKGNSIELDNSEGNLTADNSAEEADDHNGDANEAADDQKDVSQDDEDVKDDYMEYEEIYMLDNDITILFGEYTKIKIKTKDGEEYISDDFSSIPVLSPDQKRLAFISPYEFETLGELHIYDIDSKTKSTIIKTIDIGDQSSVKLVKWLDDRYLLTIIGYAYGTVSRGGSLYIYDTKENNYKLLLEKEDENRREIMDLVIKPSEVTIMYAKHDEQYMEYKVEEEVFTINELLEMIKK
ncbi:DUF4652 domain-containing protein [Alkaliphilus serpentinus]|uniref:DUF4652 domain-containing protein n=1 Tax=Alkaliphilus serpentinus TaxID=1482731 RepID=A0A833HLV7_9FIRM|nr:DUF4652 domain-containing protein [Alkaliphilus serpentinus]KAB3526772.1 DUF4652 domain-containing protein [Alkaliphilus serpentinus]